MWVLMPDREMWKRGVWRADADIVAAASSFRASV